MIDIERFFPQVMPYVVGCPEPTAIQHIREAGTAFCERTRLWREDNEIELTDASTSAVVVPADAQVFEFESARFNGVPLTPISLLELNRIWPRWREAASGVPRYLTQTDIDTIEVVPGGTGTLTVSLFLKPTVIAETLPDFLHTKYARNIADGALSTLMLIPNQPFTNPQLASVYALRFEDKLASKFNANIRGQQRAPARTKPSFF